MVFVNIPSRDAMPGVFTINAIRINIIFETQGIASLRGGFSID